MVNSSLLGAARYFILVKQIQTINANNIFSRIINKVETALFGDIEGVALMAA